MMFFEVNYFIVLGSVIFLAFCLIVVGGFFARVEEEVTLLKASATTLIASLTVIVSIMVSLFLISSAKSPTNDFSQADSINSEILEKKIVEVSEIDSLSSDSKKTVLNTGLNEFKDNGYISLSGVKGDDSINLRVSFKNDTMIIKSSVVAEGSETKTYKYAL